MASRIPKTPSMSLQSVAVEKITAANSQPHPEMFMPTPMISQVKKGIPSASSKPSSSSASAPSTQQSSVPRFTRLPAAPGGGFLANGGASSKNLETQQPCITAFSPQSISGPQLVEEQPYGSDFDGRFPRTSHASDADFSRSSTSSSCSLGSSTNLSATTSSPSASVSPALSAASSFTARPAALTSSPADEKPRTADSREPPSRCPATTTTTTTTTTSVNSTTTSGNFTTTSGNSTTTPISPSAAATCTRRPAQASVLSPDELLQALRLINGVYEMYNAQGLRQLQRLSNAMNKLEGCSGTSPQTPAPLLAPLLAPALAPAPSLAPAALAPPPLLAPAPLAPAPLLVPASTPLASVPEGDEETPAPASPRVLLAAEAEAGKELAAAAPSAQQPAASRPSKGLKHKFGKLVRGVFGGCVGRNVEAL